MKKIVFTLSGLLFFYILNAQSSSQKQNLVYKFSIQNITTPPEAKNIQYMLHQDIENSTSIFIDECDCFKISTDKQLSYQYLQTIISSYGYNIQGDIYVSDGRKLSPPIDNDTN